MLWAQQLNVGCVVGFVAVFLEQRMLALRVRGYALAYAGCNSAFNIGEKSLNENEVERNTNYEDMFRDFQIKLQVKRGH